MKNISINKLQDTLSSAVKEVEAGEIYKVSRYAKPAAYLISVKEYERLKSGEDCKKCVTELRQLVNVKTKEPKN